MDRSEMFVLNLMSQMRARDLVVEALRQRHASESDLVAARGFAEQLGLFALGHSTDLYTQLLGNPEAVLADARASASESQVAFYRLGAWSPLLLAVRGNGDGVAARIEFVARPDFSTPREAISELCPWRTVEQDWLASASQPKVVDEWYPMRDYVVVDPQTATECLVQFDFGLLQRVLRRPVGSGDDAWRDHGQLAR